MFGFYNDDELQGGGDPKARWVEYLSSLLITFRRCRAKLHIPCMASKKSTALHPTLQDSAAARLQNVPLQNVHFTILMSQVGTQKAERYRLEHLIHLVTL